MAISSADQTFRTDPITDLGYDAELRDGRPYQYGNEYKDSLLIKLNYLIDHLDPQSKNLLFKSKVVNFGLEKFDLARSLVLGDIYFKELFARLEVQQLEGILLAVRPGLELNASSNLSVQNAYNHVYLGKPVATTALIVNQAYDAFGKHFTGSLEAEAKRQQAAAIAADPTHMLEYNEIQECGYPEGEVFKLYLPLLEQSVRANFLRLIRKALNDPNTYNKAGNIRYTAYKLAQELDNAGLAKHAQQVRDKVFADRYAEYARSVEQRASKKNSNTPKPTFDRGSGFRSGMQAVVEALSRILKSMNLLKLSARTKLDPEPPMFVVPKPVPSNSYQDHGLEYDPTLARKLLDLQQKMAALGANNTQPRSVETFAPTPSHDLTFAYDKHKRSVENRKPEDIFPQLYGPHKLKP